MLVCRRDGSRSGIGASAPLRPPATMIRGPLSLLPLLLLRLPRVLPVLRRAVARPALRGRQRSGSSCVG